MKIFTGHSSKFNQEGFVMQKKQWLPFFRNGFVSGIYEESRFSFKTAFTIIELLVIIAIIAILVSLLLPAMGKARGKAYEISCLSNVRQLGIKLAAYVDSQKEYLPPRYDSPTLSIEDPKEMWYGILDIQKKILLGCGAATPNSGARVLRGMVHYGMSEFSTRGEHKRAPKLAEIITPQNMIAFSDSSHVEDYNPWIVLPEAGNRTPADQKPWVVSNPAYGSYTRFRHGNKNEIIRFATSTSKQTNPKKSQSSASFAFIDGHAEMLSPYEAYQPAGNSNWTAWHQGQARLYWKHWNNRMPVQ